MTLQDAIIFIGTDTPTATLPLLHICARGEENNQQRVIVK